MKKSLIISLFLCSVCFGQFAPHQKPMLGRQVNKAHQLGDFVACWLMNEGAGNQIYDLSGNSYTGSLVADTHFVSGKFGPALDFDGTGDYLRTYAVTSNSNHTISLWFNSDNVAATDYLFYDAGSIGFGHHNNKIYLHVAGTTGKGWGFASKSGATTISSGVWYNIVFVSDGTGIYGYLNDVLDVSDTTFTGDLIGLNQQDVGARTDLASYYAGLIDYVVIYNRALSASEISQLYSEPFCMFKDPLPVTMMYDWAVAAPSGQVIMIQMSVIPIILCLLWMNRKNV